MNLQTKEKVAIKVITKTFDKLRDEKNFLTRLRTEGEMMKFLSHQNISKIIEPF